MSLGTHGAYGVIAALELVELSDSERNRIGPQFLFFFIIIYF